MAHDVSMAPARPVVLTVAALLGAALLVPAVLTEPGADAGDAADAADAADQGAGAAQRAQGSATTSATAGAPVRLEPAPPGGAPSGPRIPDPGAEPSSPGGPDEPSAEATTPSPEGRRLSVLGFGAVGDGRTDDTEALQRALDAAGAGDAVVVPAGRTFAHDDVVRVRTDGVTVTGGGTLLATEPARSTLWVEADEATVYDIVLQGTGTRRGGTWDDTGLLLRGTQGVVVDGVTVRGATSAGVFVDGSSRFVLRDVVVEDSLADGIHLTGGSSDGRVVDPVVRRSGDDGIAVVSYRDAEPVTGIEVISPRVETTTWGRGISVVGGEDVSYTDVFVEGSDAAALYFASEANWNTHATRGVTVDGGELVGANTSDQVDHGALLVYSGDAARPVTDVRVSDLVIRDTDDRASREVGVLGAPARGVVLEDIEVEGSERGLFVSTNDASQFTLRGWSRNGDPVADVLAGR